MRIIPRQRAECCPTGYTARSDIRARSSTGGRGKHITTVFNLFSLGEKVTINPRLQVPKNKSLHFDNTCLNDVLHNT